MFQRKHHGPGRAPNQTDTGRIQFFYRFNGVDHVIAIATEGLDDSKTRADSRAAARGRPD